MSAKDSMQAMTREPIHLPQLRRRQTPRRGLRVLRVGDGAKQLRLRREPETEVELEQAGRGDPTIQTVPGAPARLVAPATDPLRFGRFVVINRVGEGAMSTVYAAHDPMLGRKVAIKLVQDDGDAESRARTQLEAHALALISHPNVVQIYEVGALGSQAFVAMEFIDGVTLTEWQAAQPHRLAETLGLYIQAGRGLVAAHGAGIVHRDFKSDNVLVGRDGRARVVDFGLALVVGGPQLTGSEPADPTASPRLTSSGTVMGTPAYMSPEQHRGASIDERSDQFNFCAALYEALYRVRPFAGNTLREVASQVRAGILQKPARGVFVPRHIRRAILRGLAATPEQRWGSLAALLDELERHDVGRPRGPRGVSGFALAAVAACAWALVLGLFAGLEHGVTARIAALNVGLVVAVSAWVIAVTRLRAGRRSFGTR
jgi:predicted Ser/Thr protein kinase